MQIFDSIERHLDAMPRDCSTVIQEINDKGGEHDEYVELFVDLPTYDADYIIRTVMRWTDISHYYNKPLYVYGFISDLRLKKLYEMVCHGYDEITLTLIPSLLRREEL